jgi:hypothetical protein
MGVGMTEHGNDRYCISRRTALTGAALALGAATVVRQAAAQDKVSQALANYQGTSKSTDHCGICINFQAPHTCKFVQGEISPKGWCQLFTPKSEN